MYSRCTGKKLSSIIGSDGAAKGVQKEFLKLMDEAIITPDSVSRYQNTIGEAKVRLDFAVAIGEWLMPSHMVINTERIVGYNNNLMKATQDMKLGVNNGVNLGTKKASLKLMGGGPSKNNPPNSHPSNPIHKKATKAQGIGGVKKKPTSHSGTKHRCTSNTDRLYWASSTNKDRLY